MCAKTVGSYPSSGYLQWHDKTIRSSAPHNNNYYFIFLLYNLFFIPNPRTVNVSEVYTYLLLERRRKKKTTRPRPFFWGGGRGGRGSQWSYTIIIITFIVICFSDPRNLIRTEVFLAFDTNTMGVVIKQFLSVVRYKNHIIIISCRF